jgi:WD40 repeat protein
VNFSPDGGNLIAVSGSGAIQLFNLHVLQPVANIVAGDSADLYSGKFSPDGRRIVVSGSGCGMLEWRIRDREKD